MRARWIIIGTVRADTQLCGWNGGGQGRGWWINWRGRTDWCQPNEFSTVEWLQSAVARRLELAGLKLLGLASRLDGVSPHRREYQPLWALVKRVDR